MTLLINHFKAQDQNKKTSDAKRTMQAERVAAIAQAAVTAGKFPVVMGDLNITTSTKTISSLFASKLLQDPFAPFEHQSPKQTWTHYYAGGQEVQRLDYILPDKRLKVVGPINLQDNTTIFRKGLTTKCLRYTGARYPTIGQMNTEASDHCPVTIVVEL